MFDKIFKVMNQIKKEQAKYPEAISDDIHCLNANDGEQFDWDCNGRCCEFYMFYKTYKDPSKFDPEDPVGAIKLCVNQDGTYDAYVYNKAYEDPDFLSFDKKLDIHLKEHFPGNVRSIHNAILKHENQGDYDFILEKGRKI